MYFIDRSLNYDYLWSSCKNSQRHVRFLAVFRFDSWKVIKLIDNSTVWFSFIIISFNITILYYAHKNISSWKFSHNFQIEKNLLNDFAKCDTILVCSLVLLLNGKSFHRTFYDYFAKWGMSSLKYNRNSLAHRNRRKNK